MKYIYIYIKISLHISCILINYRLNPQILEYHKNPLNYPLNKKNRRY